MSAALKSGELDVAIMLTEAVVAEVSKGAPFRLLGAYTSSPLTWGIHADSQRAKAAGWNPKTFAVSRFGSGSHIMPLIDARRRGQPLPEKFAVVGSLDGARKALADGTADLFMWELFTTKPLVDSGEWVRLNEVQTPWPAFAIAVRESLDKCDITKLLTIFEEVRADANALKESITAPSQIGQEYGIVEADAKAWLQTVTWCCRTEMPSDTLTFISNCLAEAGVLQPHQLRTFDSLVVPGFTVNRHLS